MSRSFYSLFRCCWVGDGVVWSGGGSEVVLVKGGFRAGWVALGSYSLVHQRKLRCAFSPYNVPTMARVHYQMCYKCHCRLLYKSRITCIRLILILWSMHSVETSNLCLLWRIRITANLFLLALSSLLYNPKPCHYVIIHSRNGSIILFFHLYTSTRTTHIDTILRQ